MPKIDVNTEEPGATYSFTWDNYQNHFPTVLRQLLDEECMLDVTLVAGGERIKAHRLVLRACSQFLADLFSQNNDEFVTVILDDFDPKDIRSIVDFMYNGEIRTPVENINNILVAAQCLKVHGLMEIDSLEGEESEILIAEDYEEANIFTELAQADDGDNSSGQIVIEDEIKAESQKDNEDSKGRKRRKSVSKKEYTDEMLSSAIDDIKNGVSLLETAAKYHIPRSTLYMRAKVLGIPLSATKSEYTPEDMKAAVKAVIAGSSLQQAADCFGVPKTVLWRRIQKEGHVIKAENRRMYDPEKREAAIKALERGEALTKVAQEYQIPKTTLFRDKVRLVDEGRLPETQWRKRKSYSDGEKRILLEKAVAACRDGTMSQATASMMFHIPKTTIWRRLQRDALKAELDAETKGEKKKPLKFKKEHTAKDDDISEDFEVYCPDEEIDITYIDDGSMSDDRVILLDEGTVNELNLQNNRLVVVQQGHDDNFITCGLDLDENSSFDTKS